MYKLEIPMALATITFLTTIFLFQCEIRKKFSFFRGVKNIANKKYKMDKEIV